LRAPKHLDDGRRALILGGSNSLKRGGYTDTLRRTLRDVTFVNLAVGATPCVMGLERCAEVADDHFDVVIIEYLINDFGLGGPEGLPLWRAGYEGLMREVLRLWPEARIVAVQLGRRGGCSRRGKRFEDQPPPS
jgi:hypothetical protein